jgi:mannose-1-phosphate guanylyltransferase
MSSSRRFQPRTLSSNPVVATQARLLALPVSISCIAIPMLSSQHLPADHVIADPDAFRKALSHATIAANQGYLVTLGIEPTHPHTGYGYVQRGEMITEGGPDDIPVYMVQRFLEKPNLETAEAFLRSGDYYWNGGIFVCRADLMLAEMERQTPDVYACLMEIARGIERGSIEQAMVSAWGRMPSISVDYGVMEQAERLAMVPLRAGWNDIGSWDALDSVLMPDEQGNLSAKSETLWSTVSTTLSIVKTNW